MPTSRRVVYPTIEAWSSHRTLGGLSWRYFSVGVSL
jgi:hypothetical protein